MRPSPSQSASATKLGTRMPGNDGRQWIVVAAKNGVHRWKPSGTKTSSGNQAPPANKPLAATPSSKKSVVKKTAGKKGARKKKDARKKQATRRVSGLAPYRLVWVRENVDRLKSLFEVDFSEANSACRETLEARIREQVELYGMLTTRSQDLTDESIAELDTLDLQCRLAYYLSEGRDILLPYLIEVVKQLAQAK